MRLFYDLYKSRLRAEVLLLATDALAISAAAFHATGALSGGGPIADLGLLVLWASIPRALAKTLGGIALPSGTYRSMAAVTALAALISVLIVAGAQLLTSLAPANDPLEPSLEAVLFFAWGSGFLLFQPRAYRLHDFLLLSTALLALKEAKPLPFVWLPVLLAALFHSSWLRHVLHDVLPDRRDEPVNLQNARAASLLAGAVASLLFAAIAVAWNGGSWTFRPADAVLARRPIPAPPSRLTGGQGGGDSAAPAAGFLWQDPDPKEGADGSARGRRIGFTHRIGLRELTRARFDPRVVLRLEPVPGSAEPAAWRKDWMDGALWKAIALSKYEGRLESWVEETETARVPWPAGGRLERPRGGVAGEAIASGPEQRLRATVVTPVLRSLVLPYSTRTVKAAGFQEYSESSMGDVFPHPRITNGTAYEIAFVPLPDRLDLRGREGSARMSAPAASLLQVPAPEEVGMDLRAMAREVFRDPRGGAAARAEELRAHFSRERFRYSQVAGWRGKEPLRRFLLEERVGNCAYYATSAALLLRAGGVPARLAAGFIGGVVEDERISLRNGDAHAWVEVFIAGDGWRPIDPSGWVPLDPDFRPAPEELARAVKGSRPAGAFEDAGAFDSRSRGGASMGDGPGTPAGDEIRGPAPEGLTDDYRAAPGEVTPEDAELAFFEEGAWMELIEHTLPDVEGDPPPASMDSLNGRLSGAGPTGRRGAALAPQEAPRASAVPRPEEESRRLKGPLRAALAAVGAIVVFFLAWTLFRRKPEELDEGIELGDGDAAARRGRADLPSLALDENDPRDRVLLEYLRLQASLERTRNHRRPHETPLEHARRAARGSPPAAAAFLGLHRVLYRLVYGGTKVLEDQARTAAESCRKLRRLLG